jgi:hypothetical protein
MPYKGGINVVKSMPVTITVKWMFQSWEGIKNSKNNGRNMNVCGIFINKRKRNFKNRNFTNKSRRLKQE